MSARKTTQDEPVKLGTIRWSGETVDVVRTVYASNGRPAIMMVDSDGLPYGQVSTNLVDAGDEVIGAGEFLVAQHNLPAALMDLLLKSGFFSDTGKRVDFGHVEGAPIWFIK